MSVSVFILYFFLSLSPPNRVGVLGQAITLFAANVAALRKPETGSGRKQNKKINKHGWSIVFFVSRGQPYLLAVAGRADARAAVGRIVCAAVAAHRAWRSMKYRK